MWCGAYIYTVHNCIWTLSVKIGPIREFRTLFVAHTDSIRERLDNKDGRVHNRVEKEGKTA